MSGLLQRIKHNLAHPADWGDLARDWTWRLAPAHRRALPPTWPISEEDRAHPPALADIAPERRFGDSGCETCAGLEQLVRVVPTALPRRSPHVVEGRLVYDGQPHEFVIDYCDYHDSIETAALDPAVVYFKMQYRRGGYGDERIVPGGYVNASMPLYRYLRRLRRLKDHAPAQHEVYGRFGLVFAAEVRQKAVAMLHEQTQFRFTGSTRIVRYGQSLREMARSKIGIDLPGNGPFCFRLVDYLAVGTCIVGPPHHAQMPVPLVDREHLYFCAEDLSDLLDLCRRLLADDAERARITRNARDYFDRYLHRDQLARYYLRTMLDHARSDVRSR